MRYSILIVDNQTTRLKLFRLATELFMRRRGDHCTVHHAEKLQQATELLERLADECETLNFAIVDICLSTESEEGLHPGEGQALLRAIHHLFPDCFLIAVSTYVNEEQLHDTPYDEFISLHHDDRDYRAQLECALSRGSEPAMR